MGVLGRSGCKLSKTGERKWNLIGWAGANEDMGEIKERNNGNGDIQGNWNGGSIII